MMEDKIEFTLDVLNQLLLAAIILGQLKPEDSPNDILKDLVVQLTELEVKNG